MSGLSENLCLVVEMKLHEPPVDNVAVQDIIDISGAVDASEGVEKEYKTILMSSIFPWCNSAWIV